MTSCLVIVNISILWKFQVSTIIPNDIYDQSKPSTQNRLHRKKKHSSL